MKLNIGSKYTIILEVGERILTYECEILEDDDSYIKFKDKYNKIFTYNKKLILSTEEIKC